MLKLVLKTPKLLSPAISLQGLGWMSHQKKPANVRKKCIRVMWLENMFEFAVIENLERNFAVIFKICFGKKIGENPYEFGTKNRKNALISTIIHSCALVLEKMLLKFCCILYFPQLPFDSSSS